MIFELDVGEKLVFSNLITVAGLFKICLIKDINIIKNVCLSLFLLKRLNEQKYN